MYIEWDLTGARTNHLFGYLIEEIHSWAARTEISYKTKTVKNKFRLILPTELDYSHFTLSWNPATRFGSQWYMTYRIIDPMKIDKKK